MLYDPKWEAPVKADPLSLDSLIAWLEKQPADKQYCYSSVGHCLAAQYNKSLGRDYLAMPIDFHSTDFDVQLETIACCASSMGGGFTFGGALTRARNLRDRHM